MAIRITETAASQAFNLDSTTANATRTYIVHAKTAGVTHPIDEIHLALDADAEPHPYRWQKLIRTRLRVNPLGGGIFTAEWDYEIPAGGFGSELPGQGGFGGGTPPPGSPPAPPPQQTPGDEEPLSGSASIEIGGTSFRLFQSVQTRHKEGAFGGLVEAPDFKRAINVVDGNKVEGVELPHQPTTVFNLTFDLPFITRGYVLRLSQLVNHTNDKTWWGFPVETVLFMGANGQFSQSGRWSFTYKLGLSPTLENVEIAPLLVIPEKRGHDYIWCLYRPEVSEGQLVHQPYAAYCEQVYKTKDFAEHLGFGD